MVPTLVSISGNGTRRRQKHNRLLQRYSVASRGGRRAGQTDSWLEVKDFLENALEALGSGRLETSPGRPALIPDAENLVFFKFQTGSSIFKPVSRFQTPVSNSPL